MSRVISRKSSFTQRTAESRKKTNKRNQKKKQRKFSFEIVVKKETRLKTVRLK